MLIFFSFIEDEYEQRKFEQLYIKYRQTMFYAANRILKDEYTAEDAVHQAFIRLLNHLDKIDEVDSYKTRAFLVVIVEHISIDIYRKQKKEDFVSYEVIEEYTSVINDSKLSHDDSIDNKVLCAMAELPVKYSVVFRLKYSQGYSNAEISELLHISEENVRQRVSRGKKKLSAILNKE